MRSYSFEYLLQLAEADGHISGGRDQLSAWLEELLSMFYSHTWPWNWKKIVRRTYASITPSDMVFNWSLGDSNINAFDPDTGSAKPFVVSGISATQLSYNMTGRYVQIGDHFYRCIKFTSNSIQLDGEIVEAGPGTNTTLTFHRTDMFLPTSMIRDLVLERRHLDRYSSTAFQKHQFSRDWEVTSGRPRAYRDNIIERIPAPLFPPVVIGTVSGGFTPGRYLYFYTRFDPESGLESAPGPILDYTAGTDTPTLNYGGIANTSEWSSFPMRLYRSERIGLSEKYQREHVPMYQSGLTLAWDSLEVTDSEQPKHRQNRRYWNGPYAGLKFIGPPDEMYRVEVECLRNWGYVPSEEDRVEVGHKEELMDILRLYFAAMRSFPSSDASAHRAAIINIRQQLGYLSTAAKEPGQGARGPETHVDYSTPHDVKTGDWVEKMPWEGDY